MEGKKVIGVAQVLQYLKDGKTRDEIAEIYGISKADCRKLFQDPRLKGKKTIKKPDFVLVEDENFDTNDVEVKDSEVVNTTEDDNQEEQVAEEVGKVQEQEEEQIQESAKATWD